MTSLWLQDHPDPVHFADGPDDPTKRFDVVVVGAGITGLTTALLLLQAGRSVAVVEARSAGAAATANTTGKLSRLQGERLSTLARHHPDSTVTAYVRATEAGMDWLLRYCAERDVPVERRTAMTFAATHEGARRVAAEHAACQAAGLPTSLVDRPDLPFPARAAVALPDQAQLDPIPLLGALAADVRAAGGELIRARVRTVNTGRHDCAVQTDTGTLHASSVVLATGFPILDRGGYFARLLAQRSYAAAFTTATELPEQMLLGVEDPGVSVRTAPGREPGSRLLLIGGFGHETGRGGPESKQVGDLVEWTRRWFPDAELVARWSAQDYRSLDELPYIGPLLPRDERIQVATGYAKWGLTTGVAAALALRGRLLDKPLDWADHLRPWRGGETMRLPEAVRRNAVVGARLAGGYARLACPLRSPEQDGEGRIGLDGRRPRGVADDDGHRRSVTPICTHLYGVLRWNDAERTWDCPLHGSRFDRDGNVLEGPATRPLGGADR